jgi:FtsP/CotA-like multicopper oxidase with cupredoxin domain
MHLGYIWDSCDEGSVLGANKHVRWCRIVGFATLLLLNSSLLGPRSLSESLRPIAANPNHIPAGILRDGVLTIQLEIARGEWHPEADDGLALNIYAFGEAGRELQNPGPLIRVPQGTEIRASLNNTLAVPIAVHGFGRSSDATVYIAPGGLEKVTFNAITPGLYFYWGASEANDLKLRFGIDSELTGAFVVDPPGRSVRDEIFVMEMMSEQPGPSARQTLATINGKSWPYTQRFEYPVDEAVHWRWINATNEPHALHLHGFYYRIDAFNRGGLVQDYSGESRPKVVTQRIAQGETFDMSWSPQRSGNWLFHCHMFQHMIRPVVPKVPGLSMTTGVHADEQMTMHDAPGMGQMVLGITVPTNPSASAPAAWHSGRKLQLEIAERNGAPRYQLHVRDFGSGETGSGGAPAEPEAANPGLIGPSIVLMRGQPVEIEVANKLNDPTAIHWHGIELESYYDGVPGWTGSGSQITPAIAPGASFVVRMTPPRAGTFIYHTHWHDPSQLTNGVYGPLIVLPPEEKFDPTSDITFVFSIGDFGALKEIALINGSPQNKTLQLQVGKTYRFRFINISTNNQGMQVSLRGVNGPVEWLNVAKDGIDMPLMAPPTKAQLTITVGETYDVKFSSDKPQDLLLDLLLPAQKIHITQSLAFSASH